jgi:hypothetical protein
MKHWASTADNVLEWHCENSSSQIIHTVQMRDATSNDALSDFRSPGAYTYNPNVVPDIALTARSALYQPI